MHIIVWRNIPGLHQLPLYRALCAHARVTVVCESDIPEWRKKMGWSAADLGDARLVVAPDDAALSALVEASDSETVHLFSGLGAYPMVDRAFIRARHRPGVRAIISEAGRWGGPRGALRVGRGIGLRLRYGRSVDAVFAIGHLAWRWYQMTGWPRERVYRFAYLIKPLEAPPEPPLAADHLRIIFIGQLIPRKGLDVALAALATIKRQAWRLTVVGDGAWRHRYERMVALGGLRDRVTFTGALANPEAMRRLEGSDLLLLPSRWDGWGAVVSEALTRGVPVICSDRCGSADLLDDPSRGQVFAASNPLSLRRALLEELRRGPRSPEARDALRAWSAKTSAPVAAEYMMRCLRAATHDGPRPAVPWRQ